MDGLAIPPIDDDGETVGDNNDENVVHNEANDGAINIVADGDIEPPDQNRIDQIGGNDK